MFTTPPSNCCAYAERTVRGIDPDNVRDVLIQHFATAEIGEREIQAFLIGLRMGAHGGFSDGRRIYGASATTLRAMYQLLSEAKTSVDDLEALQVFGKATKLYESEMAQQVQAHRGLIAITTESRWQVPLGFLEPGVEPDDEYLRQIGEDFARMHGLLVMELARVGIKRFRKEMDNPRSIAAQLKNPVPALDPPVELSLVEVGQFALEEARKDFNATMDRTMDIFSADTQDDHSKETEDLMARLKGAA